MGSGPNGLIWLKAWYDEKQLVDNLLKFIEDGKEKGFSTFFTYRKSLEIVNLVKQDIALALLSPDYFIRLLAETLITKERQ